MLSGPVRRALGERTAAALSAGVGLPSDAQCWACGEAINLLAAAPGAVTLSAVVQGPVQVTAFAHRLCGPSRVFTPAEFAALASRKPATVSTSESDQAVIVDGQRLL
jgi:hypothetical protein